MNVLGLAGACLTYSLHRVALLNAHRDKVHEPESTRQLAPRSGSMRSHIHTYIYRIGQGADFVDQELQGQSPEGVLPLPALLTGLDPRQSQDIGAITPFGRYLLDMWCATDLLILNGRVTGDRVGKLTFPHPQGGSVVDYFTASSALFALHPSLTVSETQPESDHRPLHLHLHLPSPSTPTMLQHSQCMQKLRHRPHLIPPYRDALATQLSKASTMQNSAEWLQACIATSATATHGLQSFTHTLHAPKPCFDAECWQARQALRRASHLASVHHHHSSPLPAYKALLRRKRRAWEKCQNEELCC